MYEGKTRCYGVLLKETDRLIAVVASEYLQEFVAGHVEQMAANIGMTVDTVDLVEQDYDFSHRLIVSQP